jgi:hypothetical protein
MTTTAESITRAAAVPLLLEVAETFGFLRTCVEIKIDPELWREIQEWATAMRATLAKGSAP